MIHKGHDMCCSFAHLPLDDTRPLLRWFCYNVHFIFIFKSSWFIIMFYEFTTLLLGFGRRSDLPNIIQVFNGKQQRCLRHQQQSLQDDYILHIKTMLKIRLSICGIYTLVIEHPHEHKDNSVYSITKLAVCVQGTAWSCVSLTLIIVQQPSSQVS